MSLSDRVALVSGSACADPWSDFPSTPAREAPDAPAPATAATALFVATDLQFWPTDEPEIFARDTELDGVTYRKLDPAYFSWLSSRVRLVIAAYDAHRIERPAFDAVITPWCSIYKWALDTWSPDAVTAAERADSRLYIPPRGAHERFSGQIFESDSI